MRYKHFKNANADISALGVGTWAIGGDNYGQVNRNDSISGIRAMIDAGVNLVDTAPCYGNGTSEKIVGEALKGIREKVFISTKTGLITDMYTGGYVRDASFKNIMREIESSLMNLQTDYIDFYFIHWPDPHTHIAETMCALNFLKQQGKIRYIGVSNFSDQQITEAQKYGTIDVQQPPYSMANQRFAKLMKWGFEQGIDSMTYGSLGSGILTGKIRETPRFDADDLRLTFYDFYKEPKFSKIMELLRTMDKIAEAHSKPVAHVAINWSIQKDFVGTALVGVKNPTQAKENCGALDWELSNDEIEMLDAELHHLEIS